MRFASLGGSGNFAQAGVAAGREGERIFSAVRQNSPDFQSIKETQMNIKAKKNVAQTKADALIEKSNINADAKISVAKEDIKQDNIIKGSRRKAGVVAAMGKAGMGLADAFMGKPEKRDHSASLALQERLTNSAESIRAGIKPVDFSALNNSSASTNTGGTGSSNGSTPSSSKGGSNISSIANGSYSGSLDSLSADDKKWIAYTVSSEAAMNTDDEFGVAGVVLNRMKSANYPTSAYDVGHQKGQFEGVEIGNSVHDQALHDRLFSPQGLQKLEGALTTLDGRDSFKGQALLHNRSSKGNKDGMLDPMFHSSGNYFHYSHQN